MVKYTYDAWGNNVVSNANNVIITDANHIGNLNPFRYRGYYYDTETKLYFLKTRYYDPETGRFISQDGIEYLDTDTINGLNLYAYCGNNPVSNVDPNGNAWWHWLVGIAVVAVLAVATIVSAGSAAAGFLAIAAATSGSVVAGTATTVFAFATVGTAMALTASAVVAGIGAIDTWVNGGGFLGGLEYVADYGGEALNITFSMGAFSALGGYLSYKEQIGNSSQQYHMNNSQRTAQRRAYWISQGHIDGKATPGMQINHIYGTFGNNRNYFVVQTAAEHRAFHAVYGYKTAGGAFNRINPYYNNFWKIIRRILGGM